MNETLVIFSVCSSIVVFSLPVLVSTMNIDEFELPQATNFPLGLTDTHVSGEARPLFCLNRKFFSNLIHQQLHIH